MTLLVSITASPHCGVDYAGSFKTRLYNGRSTATLKRYVYVFVCTVTNAVHHELATYQPRSSSGRIQTIHGKKKIRFRE